MNKYLAVALLAIPLVATAGHSQHGNGQGHGHGGGNSGQGQGNGGSSNPPVQPPSPPPVVPPVVVPKTGDNGSESKYGASRAIPDNISDPNRQISDVYYEQSITCVYSPNGFATSVEECYNYLNSQIQGVLDNVKEETH